MDPDYYLNDEGWKSRLLEENGFEIGVLTFGGGHFFEMQEALDTLDVDYVMVRAADP